MEQGGNHCLPSHPTKLRSNSNFNTSDSLIKRPSNTGHHKTTLPLPTVDNTRPLKAHRDPGDAIVASEINEMMKTNMEGGEEPDVAQGMGEEVREAGEEAEQQEVIMRI